MTEIQHESTIKLRLVLEKVVANHQVQDKTPRLSKLIRHRLRSFKEVSKLTTELFEKMNWAPYLIDQGKGQNGKSSFLVIPKRYQLQEPLGGDGASQEDYCLDNILEQ